MRGKRAVDSARNLGGGAGEGQGRGRGDEMGGVNETRGVDERSDS